MAASDALIEKANGVHDSAREKIATLMARDDLTLVARTQRVEQVRADANAQLQALAEQAETERVATLESLRKKVFSPKVPLGATTSDQVVIAASFRDALDRAEQAGDSRDLHAMLDRSVMTSDPIQARGVLAIALERNDVAVVNAYIEQFPAEGADIEAFYAASHHNPRADFVRNSVLYGFHY